jgi:hypothetical protein
MKNPAPLLLAFLALAAAPAADAQDGTAYYGLSIGEIDYSEDVFSDSVNAWHLMVGYMFLEHLGVEGSYGQSETIRDTETGFIAPGVSGEFSYESELDKILTIRLVGVLPFEDIGISLIGGVGYADIEQELELGFNGVPLGSIEGSGSNPAYYAAVQYDWDRIALRLGYEKYDFDGDVDAEEISLNFFYKL